MPEKAKIRWTWLKIMYTYNILGAGGFGLGYLLMPDTMITMMGMPAQDPVTFGLAGSVFLAGAFISVLGLWSPLTFAPVLLSELFYKTIWLIAVVLPLVISNRFPAYAGIMAVIFLTYIIGYLIAIPFPVIFAKEGVH